MKNDPIQIWHGAIDAEPADYQRYWWMLDAYEQDRAGKFVNQLLRNRYVEAHGRLRSVLAKMLNESPEKIAIEYSEYGKPYLADVPELAFNLSHSDNVMVVAAGWLCQLGVDIELCKSRAGFAGLVDKCFAEEESAYWNSLPEARQPVEFYRFWTRKEAFVKATGRGIGLGLNQCVINPENTGQFLRIPEQCESVSSWRIFDMDFGPGICSALVTDKDGVTPIYTTHQWHEL